MKKKSLVKLYNWKRLINLIINDMCEKEGLPRLEGQQPLHYVGGLDAQGFPYIRVDLTPLQKTDKV
jgi:hypothetical protein